MEVTLELAEAYLQDRANELLNDCKSGTPFVFINAMVILNVLSKLVGVSLSNFKYLGDSYSMDSLNAMYQRLIGNFSLTHGDQWYEVSCIKFNLSHENEKHLVNNTLSAEPFVLDIKKAITKVFDILKNDKIAAAKAYIKLNEYPFVGYGNE